MRAEEQVEFQRQVVREMGRFGRGAFSGPIVMSLSADTTVQNPPHAHSIAKNTLDLLSIPVAQLGRGRPLLYRDDRQIHGLAVRCRHRQAEPRINITATPLSCFLSDLDLCTFAARELELEDRHDDPWALDNAVDGLRDWLHDEATLRQRIGDDEYETLLDFSRFTAQSSLLRGSRIRPLELAALYGRADPRYPALAHLWQESNERLTAFFRRNTFRIHLDELPQQEGTYEAYVRHVQEQMEQYRVRFGWILQPLRVPIALQVIVKPPPPARASGLNDLDNVARRFVIPQLVEAFAPPADIAWTIDIDRIRRRDPAAAAEWLARQAELPKTAQIGLTRFEAWRVPPDNDPGFVSAAMVADVGEFWDPFIEMDETIEMLQERENDRAEAEFEW